MENRPATARERLKGAIGGLWQNSPEYRALVRTDAGKRIVSALYRVADAQPVFTLDDVTAAWNQRVPLVRRLSIHLTRQGQGEEALQVLGMDGEAFCDQLAAHLKLLEANLAAFTPEHRAQWMRKTPQLDGAHQQRELLRLVDTWLSHYRREFAGWGLSMPEGV